MTPDEMERLLDELDLLAVRYGVPKAEVARLSALVRAIAQRSPATEASHA